MYCQPVESQLSPKSNMKKNERGSGEVNRIVGTGKRVLRSAEPTKPAVNSRKCEASLAFIYSFRYRRKPPIDLLPKRACLLVHSYKMLETEIKLEYCLRRFCRPSLQTVADRRDPCLDTDDMKKLHCALPMTFPRTFLEYHTFSAHV